MTGRGVVVAVEVVVNIVRVVAVVGVMGVMDMNLIVQVLMAV